MTNGAEKARLRAEKTLLLVIIILAMFAGYQWGYSSSKAVYANETARIVTSFTDQMVEAWNEDARLKIAQRARILAELEAAGEGFVLVDMSKYVEKDTPED